MATELSIDELWTDNSTYDDTDAEILNHFLLEEDDDVMISLSDDSTDSADSIKSSQSSDSETNVETECIEEIIEKQADNMRSVDIMQTECSIAYFIQVFLENYSNNSEQIILEKTQRDDILTYLKWISNASIILASRIGQELFDPPQSHDIIRSSYNFCQKYTHCMDFYCRDETPTCREHHFVHSLLKYDVDSVISYLTSLNFDAHSSKLISGNEYKNLHLSVKTICFVTRHMAKEIGYIDYMSKFNGDIFHRNNPFDTRKKKNMIKRFGELTINNKIKNNTNSTVKIIDSIKKKTLVKYKPNNIYSVLNE